MFAGVQLNNGKTLQFGDLCYWFNPTCDGTNPVSTRVPDTIKIDDYKSDILQLPSDVAPIISSVVGEFWDGREAFDEFLATIETAMTEHVIWLWGSFENGGAFFHNTGSTTNCGFCAWNYYYREVQKDGETHQYYAIFAGTGQATIPFRTESPTVPGIYRSTEIAFFNQWTRTPDVGDLLPPRDDAGQFWAIISGFPQMYVENTDTPNITQLPLITWDQVQHLRAFSWDNFRSEYLTNYTKIVEKQDNRNEDHPWLRYIQNRVLPTNQIALDVFGDGNIKVGGYMGGSAIDESGNPYGGDTSGEGGGDGTGSDYSEDVDDGGLPSSTLISTGVASIYLPTTQNMSDFSNFLFNDITDNIEAKLKKLFANPIESILSLSLCHLKIPYTGSNTINFAGISSGVTSPVASSIFYKIEYELTLSEYWGSALDYSSYTKIKIFVPYCGIYDLNIDDVQDSIITLCYKIDILSGMCIALVKSTHTNKSGSFDSILYQFNGNVFLNVPITSTDWSSMFQSVLNMASVAIAPSPVSAVGMAESVMSQKVNVQKSGQIGSNYGYLSVQDPYIIIERPTQSIPTNFGDFYGYPSNIYGSVSKFKGYLEVDESTIWSNNIPCTDQEAEEIKTLFEGGVYL